MWMEIESCSRSKCVWCRVAVEQRVGMGGWQWERIWKDYFEDLYSMDIEEVVAAHLCGFDGVQ